MKNLLIIISFLLIHANINAQTVYKLITNRTDTYDSTSATWSFSDSESYLYDGNARHTTTTDFTYTSGVWNKNALYLFTYDAKGNTTNYLIQVWVSYLSLWRNQSQFINTYNVAGDQTLSLTQQWDTVSNTWVSTSGYKYQKTYNAANQIIDEIDQNLNAATQTWDNTYHYITTYDANSLPDTVITQTWGTGAWQNNSQTTNTYNKNKYRIQALYHSWDSAAGNWYPPSVKNIYTYDAHGNNLTNTDYIWNSSTGTWDPYKSRSTYTYTGNYNNRTSALDEFWNNVTKKYDKYAFNTQTYNINGNNTSTEQYINNNIFNVNNTDTNWTDGSRETYNYDANNNITYFLNENYNPSNHTFTPVRRTYYYYQAFNVNSVNETKNELDISLYPNPTTGIITVRNAPENIQHVTIRNILGENVLELAKPNTSDFTLDLSKFPAGIYTATFTTSNSVITKKIIRE